MDWLLRPLIFVGLFSYILGIECDDCASNYHKAMEKANIRAPENTVAYCKIIAQYRKCLSDELTGKCRGQLMFHGHDFVAKKLENNHCPPKNDVADANRQGSHAKHPDPSTPIAHSEYRPSCKYFGKYQFRHCTLFGDPHLKTFDGSYQTCRVNGTWNLIDSPYFSVNITNQPVLENSAITAPTKIVVVVHGSSTPCTLEKKYTADGQLPLPSTFDDGTDRPGSDATLSLQFQQESGNRETVHISINYIVTTLTIRRIGHYLAFSAKMPEEVLDLRRTYDNERSLELCVAGCPSHEQLDITAAHPYVMGREQAEAECGRTDGLSPDLHNVLTDSYLDWCMFDVMTSGTVYDFVAVAHAAQADANREFGQTLSNRTKPISLGSSQPPKPNSSGGASAFAGGRFRPFFSPQLPVFVSCLLCALSRFVLVAL